MRVVSSHLIAACAFLLLSSTAARGADSEQLLEQYIAVWNGADPQAQGNVFDSSAASFAAAEGHGECLRLLLDAAPELALLEDASGETLLHEAAENGDPGVLATLLERGAEIDAAESRQTPLAVAACAGNLAAVEAEQVDGVIVMSGCFSCARAVAVLSHTGSGMSRRSTCPRPSSSVSSAPA